MSLKVYAHYSRSLGSGRNAPGMFDPDSAVFHAGSYGQTLCGRRVDAPRSGGASRRGWEVSLRSLASVDCKSCLRQLAKAR